MDKKKSPNEEKVSEEKNEVLEKDDGNDIDLEKLKLQDKQELEEATIICEKLKIQQRQEREWTDEFNQVCKKLEQDVEKMRNDIDAITLENMTKKKREVLDYIHSYKDKNPIIYKSLLTPILAVLCSYTIKEFYLMLYPESIKKSNGFMLESDLQHELIIDMVMTLSRDSSSPVKVLQWRKMLYPQNLFEFETIIPQKIHEFLIASAKEKLEKLDDDVKTLVETAKKDKSVIIPEKADVENLRQYWTQLSQGKLPGTYVTESEMAWPRKTLHYMEMLNPDSETYFDKVMTEDQFEDVIEQAKKRLDSYQFLDDKTKQSPEVQKNIKHLENMIKNKKPPFGYQILQPK